MQLQGLEKKPQIYPKKTSAHSLESSAQVFTEKLRRNPTAHPFHQKPAQ